MTDRSGETAEELGKPQDELTDDELLAMAAEELEDYDFNKRFPEFLNVERDTGTRHFIVVGRRPDRDNRTAHVTLREDDGRTPLEVFTEEILYGGVASPDCGSKPDERMPLEDGLLPADWRSRPPEDYEVPEGVWAYFDLLAEIAGPPISITDDPAGDWAHVSAGAIPPAGDGPHFSELSDEAQRAIVGAALGDIPDDVSAAAKEEIRRWGDFREDGR